jgi:hypothetical protein
MIQTPTFGFDRPHIVDDEEFFRKCCRRIGIVGFFTDDRMIFPSCQWLYIPKGEKLLNYAHRDEVFLMFENHRTPIDGKLVYEYVQNYIIDTLIKPAVKNRLRWKLDLGGVKFFERQIRYVVRDAFHSAMRDHIFYDHDKWRAQHGK